MIGYVYDNVEGLAIAGATVTIDNFTATTNDAGEFALQIVPPGDRDLQVTATGYYDHFQEDYHFPEGYLILEIGMTPEGALQPPVNLAATENDQQVVLTWEEPPPMERELYGYNVYRDAAQINAETITGTTFTDNDVENFVQYSYYVTAVYTEGESAPSASVQATPHPNTVVYPSIVGDFNNWNPADPDWQLTLNDNGVWVLSAELPAGPHEYKVTETNDWAADFPTDNQTIDILAVATITFRANLGAIIGVREGDEFVTHTNPTVVGNFMSELGGTDWDPTDPTGEMIDSNDDDIFEWGAVIPEGTWEFKVTLNNNWDQATTSNNIGFVSDGIAETQITYDMATNTVETNAITPPAAEITFVVNDSVLEYFGGFYLKGTWDTETGMYDPNWGDGAEHTPFYDDGTHGDAVANDHIFSVTVALVTDGGSNTWQWGFNDLDHNWLFGNFEFFVADTTPQELSFDIPTTTPVNGHVYNSVTSEPLADATVQTLSGYDTITDADGYYSLILPVGTVTLMCSYPGYVTQTIADFVVPFNDPVTQDFAMVRELYAPINLAAEEGDQEVLLTWEMPEMPVTRNSATRTSRELTGYNIYRDDANIATVGLVDPLEYLDTGLTNNVTYTYYVTAVWDEGESLPSNSVEAMPHTMDGSGDTIIPVETMLISNSPNPFNPDTSIKFALTDDGPVRIDIINIRGQIVKTLLDAPMQAGYHTVTWDGQDQYGKSTSSGVYMVRMIAGSTQLLRKITMLK